ncbi:MAG: radical SAM protein [Thermoplasmata archaeon]
MKGAKAFGITEKQLAKSMTDPYWRRGLSSVLKGIAWFGIKKPFVPGAPFQVVWNITRACNMKCQHCYEDAGRADDDELTFEQAIHGIDILAKAGVPSIAFSGGEPTILPRIKELVRHAKDKGMYVSIATNGLMLENKNMVRDLKEAGLSYVQISLDGLDPETHDQFRGVKGAWTRTVRAIGNCVDEGLFVSIATTVTKHNAGEIPRMIDFARGLCVNWLMLYNFIPAGRGVDIARSDLSPNERYELLGTAYRETCRGGLQILSTAPQYARVAVEQTMIERNERILIPTHFGNPGYSGPTVALAEFIGGCGAGRFYLSVEPNGDVYPCVFFPHRAEVKVGNLLESDFDEMWRGARVLRSLRDKDNLKGSCGKCQYRYICGGCRARAMGYFDDPLSPDPGCISNLKEWEELTAKLEVNNANHEFRAEGSLQGSEEAIM